MLILSSLGEFLPTIIIVVVVVILLIWGVGVYNKLVKARNQVRNAWSQIDVQLTRRFDLIPNLVETVKGYASHEKDIWEKFAAARNLYERAKAGNDVAQMSEANNQISSALARLMVVQEQYPELKSDVHFTTMMQDLKETESQIAFTRQFYNDTALKYNNTREVFPAILIASICKFKMADYFKASDEAKTAPKVSF
jgi:LemA protein